MRDFTLTIYRKLLETAKGAGYSFFTFEDWCEGKALGRYVILRHDVDLKAGNSLVTARIEAELGIRATYYFRVVPQSNQPEVIKAIAALGHEIGYHYEDLALYHGDVDLAMDHFRRQLEHFRGFYPVRTICMHGSPTSKWDNRDLWKTNDYSQLGVIGEPYLDFLNQNISNSLYLTDTARMWDGDKFNIRDRKEVISDNKVISDKRLVISDKRLVISEETQNNTLPHIHSTMDFIDWLKIKPCQDVIMITTHPQRWTEKPVEWSFEYVMQHVKNVIKLWFFK